LIEDLTIGVVPVPQLLLIEHSTGPENRLLLVGDVDFDSRLNPAALPASQSSKEGDSVDGMPKRPARRFAPLPGTRREIEAVRSRFANSIGGRVETVTGTDPTEATIRRKAAGCRYLHLATHGFFGAAGLRSDPGFKAGIALAGANRPPQSGTDDGILTAVEAEQLDLEAADLVVLSACETSLGTAVGGEGLMGLQRAFQVAGARTLISSLWSVDDAATAALFDTFYANLWEKNLGKMEALRQAQLTMLREYDPRTGKLRGPGATASVDPDKLAGAQEASRKEDEPLPPFYWAAFVVSGDWR
jgi:CHAT domain-containing protein